MSANIQKRDSQTGIEMAWHKETNVVLIVDRNNSGIIYPMKKVQMGYLVNGSFMTDDEAFRIISTDDNLPIGNPIGKGYALISNEGIWEAIEKALNGVKYQIVSVGSVNDRSLVFMSIKLNGDIKAAGRETKSLLNIMWGHGGLMGVTAKNGFTIIVCQNTFNIALKERGEFTFRLVHKGNAITKLDGMSEAIDKHFGVAKEFEDAMNQFANEPVTVEQARNCFTGFIAPKTDEELSTRTENTIDELVSSFQRGTGNDGNDKSDLFGSITDYYSHSSSGGEDRYKQFVSSEFGAGQRRKAEFFEILKNEEKYQDTIKRGQLVLTK